MKLHLNTARLSEEVQARIDPPPTPIIKAAIEDVNTCNIIKIKMCQNPSAADSETYEINIDAFKNGQPENFLALLNKSKTIIDGTGTTSVEGYINYLRTLLRE